MIVDSNMLEILNGNQDCFKSKENVTSESDRQEDIFLLFVVCSYFFPRLIAGRFVLRFT